MMNYLINFKSEEWEEIIPGKVSIRKWKKGEGAFFNNERFLKIHFTIRDKNYKFLKGLTDFKVVDLSKTIPGLSHGMRGMQENEIREIAIHPSIAYDLYTTLEKGSPLFAEVQLESIIRNGETFNSPITLKEPISFPNELEEELSLLEKKACYQKGYHSWKHYKQGKGYSFEEVKMPLEHILDGKMTFPSNINVNETLNKISWDIYAEADRSSQD